MKHRILSIVLCVLLLAGLCACGGQEPQPAETPAADTPASPASDTPQATPEATPGAAAPAAAADSSYAEAYLHYRSICTAVQEEVGRRLDVHNAAVEEADPTDFFMNPDYLMLVYMPFHTNGPAVGSALAEDQLEAAQELMRSYWPDAVLRQNDANVYQADYTYADLPENGGATHMCRCIWEFDPANGSFRVTGYTDNLLTEFTEFIPQGNDTYLLYTMTDKALVTCADGAVTELYHAHMINELPLGEFVGDVRTNSLTSYDFYPAVTADKRWITEETDARYIITLRDGVMTYTGKLASDVLSADGTARVGVTWTDAGTITLRDS